MVESSGEPLRVVDPDAPLPFTVGPVRLVEDFHLAARFDHDGHNVLIAPGEERALSGEAACLHCHEADVSTRAEDVMMPAIDNCTECHDGPSRTANVPLGCVDCHEYHPALSPSPTGEDS